MLKLKILLISIYLLPFSNSINKPIVEIMKKEKPEILSNNNINRNHNIISFLDLNKYGCSFEDFYIKYIFIEEGYEKIYQIKYVNNGESNRCTIIKDISNCYNISDIKIEGGNNLDYKVNSSFVEFTFDLKKKNYAILSFKLIIKNSASKFYRSFPITIEKGLKYIFRSRQPLEIFGLEYGLLKEGKQKNGASYYYHNDTTKKNFKEIIYLTSYGIKYKSDLTISLNFTIGRILDYIKVPNFHEFGNNKILSSKVSSNLKVDEFTVEKDGKYIAVKSDKRKTKFIFRFSKEFQNSNNDWRIDADDLMNTCTTKTKNKVKEILANSNSKERDYIILGRWVYNNIKYNSNYTGKNWTVDEILDNRIGVCSHKTILYNAFLNCINIDTLYAKGFAHTNGGYIVDLDTRHSWTIAKIDGKWIPLDATWNFFSGKLPLGFVFRYYHETFRRVDSNWHAFDILGKSYISNKLGSNPEDDLIIEAISFISRELDDDDEGDFKLKLNVKDDGDIKMKSLFILILIIIAVLIYRYKNKKKLTDMNVSLLANEY